MNEKQTLELLSVIKSQYQYKFVIEGMTAITWMTLLNDEPAVPYEAAHKAALTWMRDNEWPPSVKDLRDIIASQVSGIPDADEAWTHLQSWLKAGYPGMPDNRPPLPELIRATVKELGGTIMVRQADKPEEMRKRFAAAYNRRRREVVAVTPIRPVDGPALPGGRLAIELEAS